MSTAEPGVTISAEARATLLVLSAGSFVVGIAAFVVLGLLSTITDTLQVPAADGAGLLTTYAVAYALGSPLLIAGSGRVPRRMVVTVAMLLVALGSLGCALLPTLGGMEFARAITALGGGLYSPATAAIAVSLAPPERRGWALSYVFIGFTASQGIGNAAGTWLGYRFGYQWTFLIVGALALFMALTLWRMVPAETAFRRTSLIDLGRVLTTPHLLAALSFTVCFVAATYTTITYLALILERRADLTGDAISLVLLIYGVMAFVAAVVSGPLIDKVGPSRFLVLISTLQLAVLPMVTQGPTDPVQLTLVLSTFSLLGWSHFTAQQSRLFNADPTQAQLLFALNSSMLYVGIATGSLLAGRLLPIAEFRGLAMGGEVLLLIAIAALLFGDRMVARQKAK